MKKGITIEKKKRGRKKKEIIVRDISEQIEEMAGYGLTNIEIANVLGIDDSTLGRNYENILTKGRANLKMKLRKAQIDAALKGNTVMLIWLGKQILGQTETVIDIDYNFDVKVLITDKREDYKKIE